MKFILISILFVLMSCNGQKKTVTNSVKNQLNQEHSAMVLLLQDEYGVFDTVETLVIKDQKRLRGFYAKINRTRKPGFPVPIVDFSKEMVVIHCSGAQGESGLATLVIDNETDTTLQLVSKFENTTAQRKRRITTYPFCVYKIPLTGKEILVEKSVK